MSEVWLPLILAGTAGAAAGFYLLTLGRPKPVAYLNAREEQLTRAMAQIVGCSLAQALPSVRKELEIAPNQSDETLVKRAAYHYRQELPAQACAVYKDKAPG